MLDLGGSNAERQAAERAMGAGVRIAAHHGHARERHAVLGPDNVNHALMAVPEGEIGQRAELPDVRIQRFHLLARHGILYTPFPVLGRRIVVGGGDDGIDTPRLAPRELQSFESLRAGHFMHEVAVDIEQRRSILFLVDHVAVPELVVERSRHLRNRILKR